MMGRVLLKGPAQGAQARLLEAARTVHLDITK